MVASETRALTDSRFEAVLRWAVDADVEHIVVLCADADRETITAPSAAASWAAVRLDGCLTEVPPYRLIDLALASGGSVRVAVDACSQGAAQREDLATVSTLTRGRVRVLEDPESAETTPTASVADVDVAHPPVSRRHLFRARTTPAVGVHEPDADDQTRLVASLRALGVSGDATAAPGVRLEVAGCVACGMCVRVCPHDALSLTHALGASTLTHRPDLCRGEQACLAACPESAIAAGEHYDWGTALAGAPRTLARLRTKPCPRCQTPVPLDRPQGLCEPCSLRKQDPFGWDVPAALWDRLPEHLRRRLEERPDRR